MQRFTYLLSVVILILGGLLLAGCATETVTAANVPPPTVQNYELNIVVSPMILNTARFTKYVRLAVTLNGQTSLLNQDQTPLTSGSSEYSRLVTIAEDSLITIAGGLEPDFLLSSAGKDYLRQQLAATFQQRIPTYQVENVYLTELVLQ